MQSDDGDDNTMHERIPSLDFETILSMLPAAPTTRRRKPPEPVMSDEESEKEETAISWMMHRVAPPPSPSLAMVYPQHNVEKQALKTDGDDVVDVSSPTSSCVSENSSSDYSPRLPIKKTTTPPPVKVSTVDANSTGSSENNSPSSEYASRQRFPPVSPSTTVAQPRVRRISSRHATVKEQKKKKKLVPPRKQKTSKTQHREPRHVDLSWRAVARVAMKQHPVAILLTLGTLILAYLWATPVVVAKKSTCVDTYPTSCVDYAATGACSAHPGWMLNYCASTCGECELRDPSNRCTRDYLNLTEELPAFSAFSEDDNSLEQIFGAVLDNPRWRATALSRDPWLLQIDNFLEPWECDGLINANGLNFIRSTDTGDFDEVDGGFRKVVSSTRTSENAWCLQDCEDSRAAKSIYKKIAGVVGASPQNWENLLLVRYGVGQRYGSHHDFVDTDGKAKVADLPGPRVLTAHLFLSDVEAGGETMFSALNVTVDPKKGRALFWPSVTDYDLTRKDERMVHEAKPVTSGMKYDANAWVHLFNYRKPNIWGCTGIFDTLDDSNVDHLD